MAYTYTPGDGPSVLLPAEPAGNEAASNLDDAIRQIKSFLNDATGGYVKVAADLVTAEAAITALTARVATLETTSAALDLAVPVTNNRGTFLGFMSGTQAIAHTAGETLVQYGSESFDPDSAYDPTTYIYTVPVTGIYQFNVQARITPNPSSSPVNIKHTLTIKVGGTLRASSEHDVGTDTDGRTYAMTATLQLTAGNEVSVYYTPSVDSGTATFNIVHDNNKSVFQGFRVI